jgi:hypothetical protein
MKDLEAGLPNYNYVGVGRDDGITKGEFSAIFYKKSDLRVLQEDTFWLSETPEKVSVGWDAALPRICTYAQFRTRFFKENSGISIPTLIIWVKKLELNRLN